MGRYVTSCKSAKSLCGNAPTDIRLRRLDEIRRIFEDQICVPERTRSRVCDDRSSAQTVVIEGISMLMLRAAAEL